MPQSELELLKLGGAPYEIGYQHGKNGKERIKDFLNIIVNHGKEVIPGLTKEKAIAQAKLYIPFVEAYTPHLSQEIKGIAEGAKISVEEAYLLQVRAELTQMINQEKTESVDCTSFAIDKKRTEDGELWVGQNLDLSPFYRDFGVMLHITPERGPVILCYTQIGSLAHAGINSAGIGWAANALYSSDWRHGVPRPILYRLIMEKEDLREALKAVTGAKRASSCNYLLSHKSGEIEDLEATPTHYGVIDLQGDVMVHANHFIHPEMIPFEKRPKEKLENSRFRESRLKQLLIEHPGKLTTEKLKEFLADHQLHPRGICTHAEGNPWNMATIASIIAKPLLGIMHVALGQACEKKYVTYNV